MASISRRDTIKAAALGALAVAGVSSVAKPAMAAVVRGRVRNSTGTQITFGLFGKNGAEQFRATLSPGKIVSRDFYTGNRVAVVWDDFTEELLYSEIVEIGPNQRKLDLQPGSVIASRGKAIIFEDAPEDALDTM